jgi:polyisoprenoid-binding protein YceI
VDVNSINTGNELKNKHARSEKWFDAERYPVIRFVSSNVSRHDSAYIVRGDLQLHGVTKQIAIPFIFVQDPDNAVFKGSFRVNRRDFGIGKTSGKESDSTAIELSVPVIAR